MKKFLNSLTKPILDLLQSTEEEGSILRFLSLFITGFVVAFLVVLSFYVLILTFIFGVLASIHNPVLFVVVFVITIIYLYVNTK